MNRLVTFSAALVTMLPAPTAVDRRVVARIAVASQGLDRAKFADLDDKAWNRLREAYTAQVRAEVTRLVESHVDPNDPAAQVQERLRAVLAGHRPDFEYADLPTARKAALRHGRSLVLSYTVVRPPHFDSARLFGFTEVAGHYRLAATTGDEFEGYSMFTHVLHAPTPGVMWLLVGGKATTFNGSKFRYRVVEFDGNAFRSVWSKDDVLNARLRITHTGYEIEHIRHGQSESILEAFAVTANGIVQTR